MRVVSGAGHVIELVDCDHHCARVLLLHRLPFWQQLLAEYEARGEWLRPYSLRDTFSVRAHGILKDDTLIAAAMGHSVEVHQRSYRKTEWRSVRTAFAQAGGSHAASPSKRQQQIQ